ncbi:zinc finger protein 568-like [Cephus cinctus]|uniref:Zinc finger protein 568-like n=1 Tax=Cephus cinctus TaxID=211228 RepID=A0AAJ7VYK8_CEPCN|nr:zinc finger protein 568-like [Cephus cinctus]
MIQQDESRDFPCVTQCSMFSLQIARDSESFAKIGHPARLRLPRLLRLLRLLRQVLQREGRAARSSSCAQADLHPGARARAGDVRVRLLRDANSPEGRVCRTQAHPHRRGALSVPELRAAIRYASETLLAQNSRAHPGEALFHCKVCGKAFKLRQFLNVHMKIHDKVFICDVCGASTATLCNLECHKKRHNKEYDLFCETCTKGFYTKASLQRHLMTGTRARSPFPVQPCPRRSSFSSRGWLPQAAHGKARSPREEVHLRILRFSRFTCELILGRITSVACAGNRSPVKPTWASTCARSHG